MPLFRHIYFLGQGVVGFMPLFRCIYFFGEGWALCLFLDVFIFLYIFFLKSLSFFLNIFFPFWGWGGGWA